MRHSGSPALMAIVACIAFNAGSAAAAGIPSQNVPVVVPQVGIPQWTFRINFKVDHVMPQFVAAGARCLVLTYNGVGAQVISSGFADLPLSGGAASAMLTIPVYLPNGRSANEAHYWLCDLYERDGSGTKYYPINGSGLDPGYPKEGTPNLYEIQGSLNP